MSSKGPVVYLPRKIALGIYRRLRLALFLLSPSRFANTFRWFFAMARAILARRRERRLTVAVDITPFWERLTGIGWYLYRLLEHLADRDDLRLRLYGATLVASDDMPAPVVPLPRGSALEEVMYRVPDDMVLPAGAVTRWLRKLQPLLLAADGNRVLFAPNYFLPRRYRLARGRLVATVPDLGVHLVPWSLREETHRELTEHLDRTLFEAARIITISEAVARELAEAKLAQADRVRAIHLAPATIGDGCGPLPAGIASPYVLHVGTIEPRKNIKILLDAYDRLRARGREPLPLVLCGKFGWKTEEIVERVEQGEREGWLIHPGYVTDEEIASLYRQASFVVFPTHYEGFGLPAVEAIRFGVPLVCSDLPVLREVAGEAALYVAPDDVEGWTRTLETLGEDDALRSELAEKSRRAQGRFSWAFTAEATAEVWREAAGWADKRGTDEEGEGS